MRLNKRLLADIAIVVTFYVVLAGVVTGVMAVFFVGLVDVLTGHR